MRNLTFRFKMSKTMITFIILSSLIIVFFLFIFIASDYFSTFGFGPSDSQLKRIMASPNFVEGKFKRFTPLPNWFSWDGLKISIEFFIKNTKDRSPKQVLPVENLNAKSFKEKASTGLRVTWLGHSSFIIEIEDKILLADPVWSKRISPVSIIGPGRFHPVPISINDLPPIDAIVITHDHYDHLDKVTIDSLKDQIKQFIVPLGVAAHLEGWGVSSDYINELDWYESTKLLGTNIEVTATPADHFSGRFRMNNSTLWAAWVIKSESHSLYFGCDGGYFDGFKEVGNKYGPFDLVLLEAGQYAEAWKQVHLRPFETFKAFKDLRGKKLIPTHWGTFVLAYHPWYEPAEQLVDLTKDTPEVLIIPKIGQMVEAKGDNFKNTYWWRKFIGN